MRHEALATFFFGTAALVCLLGGASLGADWPNWRGPNANGVAPDRTLPITLERDREHRLESADCRRRRLDADRERRSRLRHVADRRRGPARRQSSAPRAGLGRGRPGRTRARRRRGGGRRPVEDVLRRRGVRPRRRQARLGAADRGDGRPDAGARQAQPRDAEPGHRRHAGLCVVRHRPDRRARSHRRRGVAAAPRQGERRLRHPVGPRQLARAPRRPAHPALRPARALVPARPRQDDRQGSLEGGPRPGTLVLQHAARDRRRVRHRGHRQLDRAHRRLRCEDRGVPLARRRNQPLRRPLAGLPRRRDLRQPRLSQRALHGDQAGRPRRRARRRRRSGGSRRARRIARRSCTTTASSTWRTTSAC